MATLIGLLRAVNVGGTGKLPMAEFRELCVAAGLRDVRTYIQSGNVVFSTSLGAPAAKKKLEALLGTRLGKPCQVLIRTKAELESVVARNPFPEAEPNRLMVIFLDDAPPKSAIADVKVPGHERLHLDGRELFIHFPEGMGSSKLRVPFAAVGTGRNLNTVRKLIEMAGG
ncbi:MAG: DUF1697 domain-containing protein [Gemmatimonadaceae bacterium]